MAESLSDARLLERFASGREEAAFATLVRRHGPRVERICRRILRDENDVEDVLQATFLVMARKAAETSWCDSVSPWIDGVARRLAMHARSGNARKRALETTTDGWLPERFHPMIETSVEVERRDLRRVLDDELRRLPEKYRVPVVLCDLEGHTHEEAARRLGWPAGSMSRRLDRARSLLRRRLTCRGVGLGILCLIGLIVAAAREPERSRPDLTVRHAMSVFRSDRDEAFGAILAAAARSDREPEFDRIALAARAAATAARRIERHDRGRLDRLWARFATEMGAAAGDLERACETSKASAVALAARRLDASCVRCHAVFREDVRPASLGDLPVSNRFREPAPRWPDLPAPVRGNDVRLRGIPVARDPGAGGEVVRGFPLIASNDWMDAVVWRKGLAGPIGGRSPRRAFGPPVRRGAFESRGPGVPARGDDTRAC